MHQYREYRHLVESGVPQTALVEQLAFNATPSPVISVFEIF